MTTSTSTVLLGLCHELHLPAVLRHATQLHQEALRQKTDPIAFVEQLLAIELQERRRIKEAGFPLLKTLEGFAFDGAPHLPEARLRQLADGSFIE